jgi:hypothetical protein
VEINDLQYFEHLGSSGSGEVRYREMVRLQLKLVRYLVTLLTEVDDHIYSMTFEVVEIVPIEGKGTSYDIFTHPGEIRWWLTHNSSIVN